MSMMALIKGKKNVYIGSKIDINGRGEILTSIKNFEYLEGHSSVSFTADLCTTFCYYI